MDNPGEGTKPGETNAAEEVSQSPEQETGALDSPSCPTHAQSSSGASPTTSPPHSDSDSPDFRALYPTEPGETLGGPAQVPCDVERHSSAPNIPCALGALELSTQRAPTPESARPRKSGALRVSVCSERRLSRASTISFRIQDKIYESKSAARPSGGTKLSGMSEVFIGSELPDSELRSDPLAGQRDDGMSLPPARGHSRLRSLLSRSRSHSGRSLIDKILSSKDEGSKVEDITSLQSLKTSSSRTLHKERQEWLQWWRQRLNQLHDRRARERLEEDARLLYEALTPLAYELGSSLLGLPQTCPSAPHHHATVFMAPTSDLPSPTNVYSPPRESSASADAPTQPAAPRSSREVKRNRSILRNTIVLSPPSSKLSRRVSFSDFGLSLNAQPPSSGARSRHRRPGRKRKVVLEEPSSYLRFLRRSDRPGFRPPWRTQPDAVRADTRLDQMVTELCEWMRTLESPEMCGMEKGDSAMSAEDVRKMFTINLEGPEARSVAVDIGEINSVPLGVANDTGQPQLSEVARLMAHAHEDMRAERRPRREHAFGSSLSHSDLARRRPQQSSTTVCQRWGAQHSDLELENMECVFEGMGHLRVTRDFVKYLDKKGMSYPPCALEGAPAEFQDD